MEPCGAHLDRPCSVDSAPSLSRSSLTQPPPPTPPRPRYLWPHRCVVDQLLDWTTPPIHTQERFGPLITEWSNGKVEVERTSPDKYFCSVIRDRSGRVIRWRLFVTHLKKMPTTKVSRRERWFGWTLFPTNRLARTIYTSDAFTQILFGRGTLESDGN